MRRTHESLFSRAEIEQLHAQQQQMMQRLAELLRDRR